MDYHLVWGTNGDLNMCFRVLSIALSPQSNFETRHVPVKIGKRKNRTVEQIHELLLV